MPGRVLSIQSHVASGYGGVTAATFPLQVLGYDVDTVNTVQYTNHAGYGRFGGSKTKPEDLEQIFDMMKKNRLLVSTTRVLTGYIPDASSLRAVAKVIIDLRRGRNNDITYLLDPVMGDDDQMYVAEDVLPVYLGTLLPLADIITPNWFETELLTGLKISGVRSIQEALHKLHTVNGVPNIVISSIKVTSESLPTGADDYLLCLTSTLLSTNHDAATSASPATRGRKYSQALSIVHAICFPKIQGYFSGAGDLFSALVLGHFAPGSSRTALADATSLALSTTQAIIASTHKYCSALSEEECPLTDEELDAQDRERRVNRMRARELRIVSEMREICVPSQQLKLAEWETFWECF
ncbi:Ribokinase-like protein [Cantharellus anzutake]|uniref:Ribokinase-like protein n=1 Tax=Cantharellus anzutake TaxID=1750568 RepID=UPI0019037417|nr:Ribokinase-like protein [Cantharellus anzutake]KAF8325402.1 Ribokinase-like protein [Cantharellus anzutake]